MAARFKCGFASEGSIPMYVGWCLRRLSTTSTLNDYIESGDCAYRILGDADGGSGVQTLMGSVNIGNYLGLDQTDNDLEAGYLANPTEQLYLHVFCAAMAPTLDPNAISAGVTIDYDTKWRERALQVQS